MMLALAWAALVQGHGTAESTQLDGGDAWLPRVEEASPEAAAAIANFQVPSGFVTELVAAEPWLANPVCFHLDHRGDLYVNETFRHSEGVDDIREKMHLMERDVANQTVAERVAMLRKDAGEAFEATYEVTDERVRLIRDTDGDGEFDTATVFADQFKNPASGIAAGVLSYRGDVFYACIPDLWRLRDLDGDGVAEEREALSSGYGVNIAMLGHDLHGLVVGPDRRLYFSCGDRGFNIETPNGVIDHAFAGGVLRSELDGSNLEVFASGLRNPQELTFDALGNLFTGDNNSDGGDRARWVQVVRGGDSGWRYGYQWITEPMLRGPWNDEKLWHPRHAGQAAYLIPPIANLAAGPSGLTYSPGTGLPPEFADHFFLCDFRGEPSISGVHAFDLARDGAGFALGEVEPFVWGSLTTDADFGPDGGLYFSDWVSGWAKTGKGRIYRAYHPDHRAEGLATATLLRAGMDGRGSEELRELLSHADRRVRQEAHFALVDLGAEGLGTLTSVALERSQDAYARYHAIWGVGIVARRDASALEPLLGLLQDSDADVRDQVARVIGDARLASAIPALIEILRSDPAVRVRASAALALGSIGPPAAPALPALVNLLDVAGEEDPILRHAAVLGLAEVASDLDLTRLATQARTSGTQVRRGIVVVLRRRGSALAAGFLTDTDPLVATEAARAVYDTSISAGYEALAGMLKGRGAKGTPLVRRALAANLRLGGAERAARVAAFAANPERAPQRRLEALRVLRAWSAPAGRDWVTGEWRPIAPRPALSPQIAVDLAGAELAPDQAREWIALAVDLDARELEPHFLGLLTDTAQAVVVREAALGALEDWGASALRSLLPSLLSDPEPKVRASALLTLERLDPGALAPALERTLRIGSVDELRAAYGVLGRLDDAASADLLGSELQRLEAGFVSPEVALDLVQACEARPSSSVATRLGERTKRRALDAELAPWLDSLFGGDAQRGRRVFVRADVSCIRCHRIESQTGTEVGPDLRGISERTTRVQLAESIVLPNRHMTLGFENWTFALKDGRIVAGRIVAEDAETVRIQGSDSQYVEFGVNEIELRKESLSAMPENLAESLTREDLRDLVEYLSGV